MSITRVALFGLVTLTTPFPGVNAPAAAPAAGQSHQHLALPTNSATSALVEQVRRVTEELLDVQEAIAAGYSPFLGCVSGPQEGAMGVHYVNGDLVGDGVIDANRPEALIFETMSGVTHMVGVEYIVMVDDWNKNHSTPPVLAGQVFQYNSAPNRYGLPAFYELHVWAWRDNPKGAYVDWNVNVSCEGQ
jgi:hypothetical protein